MIKDSYQVVAYSYGVADRNIEVLSTCNKLIRCPLRTGWFDARSLYASNPTRCKHDHQVLGKSAGLIDSQEAAIVEAHSH